MGLKDIESQIEEEEGESQTLEFKKSTSKLREAFETVCGFLNTEGGKVLIGVSDEGEIVGQQVSDRTKRRIAQRVANLDPVSPVDIDYVPVDDAAESYVIVLTAEPDHNLRPFVYDGRPWERIQTTTQKMSQEQYEEMLLQRDRNRSDWEEEPTSDYAVDDLDHEEILGTLRRGIENNRLPESSERDPESVLKRLHLLQDGSLLNAAVVLFGTNLMPEYSQCQLKLARFKGTDKGQFIDNRQVRGHAFQILEEAMMFLRSHLPVAGRIQAGLFEREDEPLFPVEALREALVNAICHRDYENPGGSVSLGIYDDRLEIWNIGVLPEELSTEDLKRDHESILRNPLIADVLYKRGLVEQWGRGTQRIVELCVKAGHPEPEFLEQGGSFGVRFLPSGYIAPHRVDYDLTERQRQVLNILAEGELALREIVPRVEEQVSAETIKDDLQSLKELDLIDTEGHGRGAVWFLKRRN